MAHYQVQVRKEIIQTLLIPADSAAEAKAIARSSDPETKGEVCHTEATAKPYRIVSCAVDDDQFQ